MSDLDICTLGAAKINGQTNVMTVEVSRDTGLDDESEPLGTAPMVSCLGVTAMPAPPTAEGHAEGVTLSPCGPYTTAVIGGADTRSADVVGQLTPGDTALHGTHADADKRASVFCKENLLAILVGNDTAVVIDRENKAITVNDANGNQVEISKDGGIMLLESGGAWLQLKGGLVTISGSSLNICGAASIGNAAASPVALAVPTAGALTAIGAAAAAGVGAISPVETGFAAFAAALAVPASLPAFIPLVPALFTKAS